MVDTQVRPSDVTKFPIIDAMLTVPREAFVPARLAEAAYIGEMLDIGDGRLLLEPRTFAKMLDALAIQSSDIVLDVACGLGYSAAVLARMAEFVVGLEDDKARAAEAQSNLSHGSFDNAVVMASDLTAGAETSGPFDVILIEGAVEVVPDALLAQLKENGRIAAIFREGALGSVRIGLKTDGRVSWRFVFNANAPVLPGFEKEQTFTL